MTLKSPCIKQSLKTPTQPFPWVAIPNKVIRRPDETATPSLMCRIKSEMELGGPREGGNSIAGG